MAQDGLIFNLSLNEVQNQLDSLGKKVNIMAQIFAYESGKLYLMTLTRVDNSEPCETMYCTASCPYIS